jgi:hypothetical protein
MALPRRMRHLLLQLLLQMKAESRDAVPGISYSGSPAREAMKKEALLGEDIADKRTSVWQV